MTTSPIVIRINAANLHNLYVLAHVDGSAISGVLTSYDDTGFTLAHVDHTGTPTGSTTHAYADTTSLVNFYDDADDVDLD